MKNLSDFARGALPTRGSDDSALSAFPAAIAAFSAASSARSAHYSSASNSCYSAAAAASAYAVDPSDSGTRASYSAASFDTNHPGNWEELWPDAPQPHILTKAWDALKEQWNADGPHWSFWITWYEAILDGTWTNWDLIYELATQISDADWEAGQARVAERIAEIRKDFEAEPLEQDALQAHVQKLVQNPVLNADIARSAGQQIESIVRAFKAEAPANQLPNGFEAFENLPPTFFAISAAFNVTTADTPDRAALQEKINRLHGVIAQLRSDLHEAKLQLLDARLTASEAQQIRTFAEKAATTLTSIVSLGVIAGGMAWFFGVPEDELRYEALKDRLNGLVEEMEKVQPSQDADTLPPATDV